MASERWQNAEKKALEGINEMLDAVHDALRYPGDGDGRNPDELKALRAKLEETKDMLLEDHN